MKNTSLSERARIRYGKALSLIEGHLFTFIIASNVAGAIVAYFFPGIRNAVLNFFLIYDVLFFVLTRFTIVYSCFKLVFPWRVLSIVVTDEMKALSDKERTRFIMKEFPYLVAFLRSRGIRRFRFETHVCYAAAMTSFFETEDTGITFLRTVKRNDRSAFSWFLRFIFPFLRQKYQCGNSDIKNVSILYTGKRWNNEMPSVCEGSGRKASRKNDSFRFIATMK